MTKSIKRIALIVSSGTLVSKIGGLARQLVIAGAFGIGSAYNAYNYAYILPGFFLVLLGGINGPFHNAMVSVLSRKSIEEGNEITRIININIGSLLIIISAFLFIAADPIIKIIGPGLSSEVHKIAVIQLQIMSPIAFFSGLIGIGFGYLNAKDEFFIPSISPLISSIAIIITISAFWWHQEFQINSYNYALRGGILLAIATLSGAILQWIVQMPSLIKKGLAQFQWKWDWKHSGAKEVWQILFPATLASGMLQINVFTDLFFASGIIGAAAGLGYANFVIQAPLGLISNAILLPLLPILSRLSKPQNREELIKKIEKGLILSIASMIGLGALFISLSTPIIILIYGRGAFDNSAISLVSKLLIAYGIGMPAYLARDFLVRVYYAIGDVKTPFKLSLIGIFINILLDWVLIGGPSPDGNYFQFNFGAQGLVFATVLINFLTCIYLLIRLNFHLKIIPIDKWVLKIIKLLFSGFLSILVISYLSSIIVWPKSLFGLSIGISIFSSISILIFLFSAKFLHVNEVDDLIIIFRKKLTHF
tara:strand:- start:3033 stop:4640 length:1608 start_codon:yes stop_codon:yes gene_type:complete